MFVKTTVSNGKKKKSICRSTNWGWSDGKADEEKETLSSGLLG